MEERQNLALVNLEAFAPAETRQGVTTFASPHLTASGCRRRASLVTEGVVAPNGFERWASARDDLRWSQELTALYPVPHFDLCGELIERESEPHAAHASIEPDMTPRRFASSTNAIKTIWPGSAKSWIACKMRWWNNRKRLPTFC